MGKLCNTPLIGLPHACAYDFENRAQLIELIQFRFQPQIKKEKMLTNRFSSRRQQNIKILQQELKSLKVQACF